MQLHFGHCTVFFYQYVMINLSAHKFSIRNYARLFHDKFKYLRNILLACWNSWDCTGSIDRGPVSQCPKVIFMPLPVIIHRRHSVFGLSVCQCVCLWSCIISLCTRYLRPLVEILPNLQLTYRSIKSSLIINFAAKMAE